MNKTVEEKLDMLAEFEAQRALIEIDKRALLDEVKVPAEIQAIVNSGMARTAAPLPIDIVFEAQIEAELAALVIPDEVREILKSIDLQRDAIQQKRGAHRVELELAQGIERHKIQMEINAATEVVYRNIALRKAEIEAEFSGNLDAVNANIEALKAEIKAETVAAKKTFKGKFYQSIFMAGRVTWNTDMIEGMIALVPQLAQARKEGAPSTQLRKI